MNKKSVIDSVVVLGGAADQLRRMILEIRPDLNVYGSDVDKRLLTDKRYAVITFNPGSVINDYDGARWIHCSGAGVDFLLDALNQPVPLITRTVGRMGDQIAEYVLAYLLYFRQRIGPRYELQAERKWDQTVATPRYLDGSRALVFGTGAIGSAIAHRLSAFRVQCVGVSRTGDARAPFQQVVPISEIQALALDRFEFVVLALPDHPATRSLLGSSILERLDAAILFNVGRAQVLATHDLLQALDSGVIENAILDVFEQEPLPDNSPLWSHSRVTVTPHVSGLSQMDDVAEAFLAALEKQDAGLQPDLVVSQKRGY